MQQKEMKKIILDTNFLLIPATLKVDIFSEIEKICDFKYELYVVDSTIEELKHIMESQRGKHRDAARIGLQLIEAKALKTLPSSQSSTDEAILALADLDCLVATQDKALKKALKQKKVNVIFLRQKKYLAIG
jgi:rRNA-processing protein FCF1